jgi:hypothetical protein
MIMRPSSLDFFGLTSYRVASPKYDQLSLGITLWHRPAPN